MAAIPDRGLVLHVREGDIIRLTSAEGDVAEVDVLPQRDGNFSLRFRADYWALEINLKEGGAPIRRPWHRA